MYVWAIGVCSVMGVSLILGHLRDQAARAPRQWRHFGVSASQLLGAWVSGHLGHAGLLLQAVAWWPSWCIAGGWVPGASMARTDGACRIALIRFSVGNLLSRCLP
jgi:hypothetical protein